MRIYVSYLSHPIEDSIEAPRHSNERECLVIVKILKNLGFEIDLVPCYTPALKKFHPSKSYDVIFGFGPNYIRACELNPKAKKIAYLTESSPNFSLTQESERIRNFQKRTGKKISISRSGLYLRNRDIEISDFGILIGNHVTLKSYQSYQKKILTIPATGLMNANFSEKKLTSAHSKKDFLWLGSHGAIHKGLDLCIEAFKKMPQKTLYVAGLNKEDQWLLKNATQNIINLGFLNIQSDKFLNICSKCRFMILPSCSEGMSTSVITAMNHGLIPVITKETGVDLPFKELYLSSTKIDAIIMKIEELSATKSDQLDKTQIEIYGLAQKKYSIENFERCFKESLGYLLNEN